MTDARVQGQPTAVDLFSGAGGLSIGLQDAGFEVVAALDSWGPAVETYRRNLDHVVIEADIRLMKVDEFREKVALPDTIDLVAGGPPCQGFSVQRIGDDEDHRNNLVYEFMRFVLGLRPRAFLMENVPGLIGKRGSGVAARFSRELAEGGYEVRQLIVVAADYGVPQLRRRVLYFGWPAGSAPLLLPEPTHSPATYPTVWDAIGDLDEPPADPKAPTADPLHRRSRLSDLNVERLGLIPPGGGFESLPVHLRVNAHRAGAARIGHRNVYGRLDPDRPAGTITARFDSFTRGKFAHPYQDRNITLREGARLQTFPDDYVFVGTREDIAAQIGNAVPPRLAWVIGEALARQLRVGEGSQSSSRLRPDQLRMFPPQSSVQTEAS